MNLPTEIAVYAEHSDTTKEMVMYPKPAGPWNTRVFNRIEAQVGQSIGLDESTGIVTLAPGFYHITACSIVTYAEPEAEDQTTVPISTRPNGGYCRLRHLADIGCPNERAIAVGTISNANMVPSTIDAYVNVEDGARIILEHQVGDAVGGIYLQVGAGGSSWHVFARIAIRRM
jgi:hypothetical protein